MADLKNITLTVEATQFVADLRDALGISDQMEIIRLGFAYALEQGAGLDRDPGIRRGSNYDSPGLDTEGLMADAVKLYYEDPEVQAEPYRAVEILMNKGLRMLYEDHRDGIIGSLSDLVDEHAC